MTITGSTETLCGYHGRYLKIDVSGPHVDTRPLSATILRRFVGGSGLGTYLLLKYGAATSDPLSAAAPLVLASSPLAGSPLTTTAKMAIVCKSPLTNRINDSLISGAFALATKRNGCDAILILGRATQPSILIIDHGQVRLEPAGAVWGQTCDEAQRCLTDTYGNDFDVAVIGPAGEHQVRFATISHARRHAGRGGSGAVLGSKNLKAILVRGSAACSWAHPEDLIAAAQDLSHRSLGPATAKYRELGTVSNLLVLHRLHALPTRNFQRGSLEDISQFAAEKLASTRTRNRNACVACTIGCEHLFGTNGNSNGDEQHASKSTRAEYENLFALGPLCGISDPKTALAASRRCDQLGLDTISTGGVIAFAMECADRAWLDASWLSFGSGKALRQAIDLIGYRQGLGNLLAEGTRAMAQKLGPEAAAIAPHVKGLELPGYEPRSMQSLALGLAIATRGADHNRTGAIDVDFSHQVNRRQLTPATAQLVAETEDRAVLMDSLILCRFLRNVLDDFLWEAANMLRLVTGWHVDHLELKRTAQRIVTARKLFNVRAGWQPAEDDLPLRFFQQSLPDDPAARLSRQQLQDAIWQYNELRGWDRQGWIPVELLQDLELDQL